MASRSESSGCRAPASRRCSTRGAHRRAATGDVGMAGIPDPRLAQIAEVIHPRKVTPAAIRVVEVAARGPSCSGICAR